MWLKMVAPLRSFIKEEQPPLFDFYGVKAWNQLIYIVLKIWNMGTPICLSTNSTNGAKHLQTVQGYWLIFNCLSDLPNSPDLVPSNLHIFDPLNKHLVSQQCKTTEDVKSAEHEWILSHLKDFVVRVIDTLPLQNTELSISNRRITACCFYQ